MTTQLFTSEDQAKLRTLFEKTADFIYQYKDSPNGEKYFYIPLVDSDLTKKISKEYAACKTAVEELSKGKYTLLRESTVNLDPNNYNDFLIADISRTIL